MYSLGGYPGIKRGSGHIAVELYEVDAATLRSLDSLEGFSEGGDNTFYDRVSVTTVDQADTLIYVYMGPVNADRQVTAVASW